MTNPLEFRTQFERDAARMALFAAAAANCHYCREGKKAELHSSYRWTHEVPMGDVSEVAQIMAPDRMTTIECHAGRIHDVRLQLDAQPLGYQVGWRYVMTIEGGGGVLIEGSEPFAAEWGQPVTDYAARMMNEAHAEGFLFDDKQTREGEMNVINIRAVRMPGADDELDDETVLGIMSLVIHPFEDIERARLLISAWTEEDRRSAVAWAGAVHYHASDNDDVVVPPRPEHTFDFEAALQCGLCWKAARIEHNPGVGWVHPAAEGKANFICLAQHSHDARRRQAEAS